MPFTPALKNRQDDLAGIGMAMQKALGKSEVSFKSEEQKLAMEAIVLAEQTTPLVVILPTGGGKSLLFMAPACLEDPGITIVVVPFRALINNLVETAKKAGIDSTEWRPGTVNPASLVFVSADSVANGGFRGYARSLHAKGLLRRVFVDECHLTFTASDWRAKLAHIRLVRGFGCPTILLTATLPCMLEFELEEAMAAQMARYIRAVTTRVRTRYIVDVCKRGKVEDTAVKLCKRMTKHLGQKKGVVYSRSRDQCEDLARELGCAYYHAGAADNEGNLKRWLEKGGLMVATSALGTGVDFPGIVFVLHVDLPYSMIDFAQESGRAGRAGEEVDSVIIVEEGRVERLSRQMRGVDEFKMMEFVTTRTCRRAVMSMHLDGESIECAKEDMARCDRCGEGLTALERSYRRAAYERQVVEEVLDEVSDNCASCWVRRRASDQGLDHDQEENWMHAGRSCKSREEQGVYDRECNEFRRRIRYEVSSHSCHKCGISQKLCATGRDEKAKCQWSNVMAPVLLSLTKIGAGVDVFERAGFEGNMEDLGELTKWLGLRHKRRVWGEVISNAMAVLIGYMLSRQVASNDEDERIRAGFNPEAEQVDMDEANIEEVQYQRHQGGEEEEMEKEQEKRLARIQARVTECREPDEETVLKKFRVSFWGWEGVCVICKARRSVEESKTRWTGTEAWEAEQHRWIDCPVDEFAREMVRRGIRQMEGIRPDKGAGCLECWLPLGLCGRFRERDTGSRVGRRRFERDLEGWCQWMEVAKAAAIALLYVGPEEVREWARQDERFRVRCESGNGTEEDASQALQELLGRQVKWGRTDSNMMCELIRIWS